MRKEEKVVLIEKNPQLVKDVSLFKIALMPLELYVLKYFINNLRPMNIREVYSEAIHITFNNLFDPDGWKHLSGDARGYLYLYPQIVSAGYGLGLVDEKERQKVMRKYVKELSGISETRLRNAWLEQLKKYNSKTPSYDKFKAIFENFERLGIIYKRGKEGKGIVYALNPVFYTMFKDKRKEILNL